LIGASLVSLFFRFSQKTNAWGETWGHPIIVVAMAIQLNRGEKEIEKRARLIVLV
jgi:hypothetical protein